MGENRYLIPVNINKRFEFFPGFGWKELFLMTILGGVGLLFSLFLGLFISHPARYLCIVILAGIGYLLAKPQEGSMTGFDMLIYIRNFFKSQKIYLFERRM